MQTLVAGFLAGLSVGVYCLGLCLPIFVPYLLSQSRTAKSSLQVVLEFSLGRLLGYLTFGFLIGFLGEQITNLTVHKLVALGNIWTGLLMILYSLGAIDKKFCAALPFQKIRWVLLLGFLTGVNICPPFLASLTYVFNLQGTLLATLYFLTFFLGTSVYIVPAALLGIFTKFLWLQKLARLSGVLVGLYFVLQSLIRFL